MMWHAHRAAGAEARLFSGGLARRIGLIDDDLVAGLKVAAADFHVSAIVEAAPHIDAPNLAVVLDPQMALAIGIRGFDGVAAAAGSFMMMMLVLLGTRGREPQRLQRHLEDIIALGGDDPRVGRHPRLEE